MHIGKKMLKYLILKYLCARDAFAVTGTTKEREDSVSTENLITLRKCSAAQQFCVEPTFPPV